jgi:hypothetical protein
VFCERNCEKESHESARPTPVFACNEVIHESGDAAFLLPPVAPWGTRLGGVNGCQEKVPLETRFTKASTGN